VSKTKQPNDAVGMKGQIGFPKPPRLERASGGEELTVTIERR